MARSSRGAVIALQLDWSGRPLDPDAVRRFAAALAAGGTRSAAQYRGDGLAAVTLYDAAAEARRWQPAQLPDGGIVLFHGWIGNRGELERALGGPCPSDAALYVAGYRSWGRSDQPQGYRRVRRDHRLAATP